MNTIDDDFLEYYYRELNYLHSAGAAFAQDFPKIASRLSISSAESTDPHVERLIESFAFLTARSQHRVDNIAKELTTALIEVLYPHLNRQLPAMAVAEFQTQGASGMPPAEGYKIPKFTELFAYAADDNVCRFRTIYPLTLFPIRLQNARVVANNAYTFLSPPRIADFGYDRWKELPPYFLELELNCLEGTFKDLACQELLLYLNIADKAFKMQVYQALFSAQSVVYSIRNDEHIAVPMLPDTLVPMGLERGETLIPPLPHETHAYQLLQEYFHFPEKFMFLTVKNFEFLRYLNNETFLDTNKIKILLPLKGATSEWKQRIDVHSVLLNSTPIVNLYSLITDPISFDQRQTFYSLIPDAKHDRTMEIYQINDVFSINSDNNTETRLQPYFNFKSGEPEEDTVYWWSKTERTKHANVEGTDALLTLVDATLTPIDPSDKIIYAKTLCTNRFLAEDIPQNAKLEIEAPAPVSKIVCVQKPVSPQYHLDTGENHARLISQLSANYVGMPYGLDPDLSEYVKRLLQMHVGSQDKKHITALLSAMQKVSVHHIMRRITEDSWNGLLTGIQVDLELNKTDYIHDWFLLAKVLQRYFAMNCQINTFVDLRLSEENIEIVRFASLLGSQHFI